MKNLVLSNSSILTMSSREIAELVDSRHDKVKLSLLFAHKTACDASTAEV